MMDFRKKEPIHQRGDILALKLNFDGDWEKFIRTWAIREPALVNAYHQGGFEAAIKLGKVKYAHLPTRLTRYMKPKAVETWTDESVRLFAKELKQSVENGAVADYKMTINFCQED